MLNAVFALSLRVMRFAFKTQIDDESKKCFVVWMTKKGIIMLLSCSNTMAAVVVSLPCNS